VCNPKLSSIQEQVQATVGRMHQLAQSIEEHYGLDSTITRRVKAALESLTELADEISRQ
jgi:hypothetical protein